MILLQCVKSKSVTNLAEATADPVLDAGGNPIIAMGGPEIVVAELEEGAVGGVEPTVPISQTE